jgi:hypothetical protein
MTADRGTSDLTWRPGGPRYIAYVVVVILLVLTVVIGAALPEDITFTPAELVTLALFLIATIVMLHGVGRSRVIADGAGVQVLNGYRHHSVPWADVEGFSMNTGAPWPTLVTTDDERVMLFAIQATDGPAARAVVRRLQERLEQYRVDELQRDLDTGDER